ncbi:unnamed protein product [Lactuca saligna]|uniref:HSF-type DNA-binding domain-containing protein n=1 Tax=Lactuca saligna TaxID=75948 RepID=A0AA35ZIP3_LACSI|nr:unnamed protein product [Lactuca saligna]
MEHVEVEEIEIVSDISEGYSNSRREPIRGVRNGSLPPFVTKLYDMVSNKTINSTISWVGATSFVILNEQNFINNLLPKMSKSNKFDSFISQLNIYGFKKISWDRREYAHEWFQKGKRHLLRNIKRRKKGNTSMVDKMTLEIKNLQHKSNELRLELSKFKEYIDNTMSSQKRIIQEMENMIKSTFGECPHVCCAHTSNESNNNNKSLFTMSENECLGQRSFTQSLVIEVENEPPKNT